MGESLAQSERVRKYIGGIRPKIIVTGIGFRGKKEVGGTQILIPKNRKESSRYEQEVARKRFRSRAAIEPTISYLKRNRDLGLNFSKAWLEMSIMHFWQESDTI